MKVWRKIELCGSIFIILFGGLYLYFLRNKQMVGGEAVGIVGMITLLFIIICEFQNKKEEKGEKNPLNELTHIFIDYKFLLKQLVGRDFAVKYRRSYLGFLWTIVNPLMTMIVMSAVFAFIFKVEVEYYSVYLIIGNVVFNFFSEATQLALTSIVGSGQLIKKVYMPKYIFPLSKVMFSFVNFLITLIPVAIVMLYYKIYLTSYILLLPIIWLYLFFFSLGIGLILATLQVTLRDTQYLYGILLTLWTYLTPIFYSVDSLSPAMQGIMKFNPMYIYVNATRQLLIYHTLPATEQMIGGLVYAVVFLFIGLTVFYKHQKKFILHI